MGDGSFVSLRVKCEAQKPALHSSPFFPTCSHPADPAVGVGQNGNTFPVTNSSNPEMVLLLMQWLYRSRKILTVFLVTRSLLLGFGTKINKKGLHVCVAFISSASEAALVSIMPSYSLSRQERGQSMRLSQQTCQQSSQVPYAATWRCGLRLTPSNDSKFTKP